MLTNKKKYDIIQLRTKEGKCFEMDEEKLFEENMNLVPYVLLEVLHLDTKEFDFEDLLQEGYILLWKAVKTYNQEKYPAFSTYACCCIRNRMINYLNSPRRTFHRNQYLMDISLDKKLKKEERIVFHDIINPKEERDLNLYVAIKDVLNSLDKNNIKTKILFDKMAGYTRQEIAKKYNMSHNTVNVYLGQVRKEVKYLLS